MHITRYSDYCLRTLIFLALQGDRLATIQEVSRSYNISKNHLMKIVYQLSQKGYINSTRGKNGGIRLGRDPEQINLGTLFTEVEQSFSIAECFSSNNRCAITPACHMKKILSEALTAFLAVLGKYTLADLVSPRHQPELIRLLQMP